jgi:hypothetical protein
MRRSGRHDAHPLRQPQQDHYPTTTPPQHSGGASSTSYRKRRTNTRPPRGSPSDPAHDHQVTRPAATQATLGADTRVRSEPLKTSTHHNAGEVFHGAYSAQARRTPKGYAHRGTKAVMPPLLTIDHRDLSTVLLEKERHSPDLANRDRNPPGGTP